jgi:NAD(P)-dependent dehydrogenase (short-subunit alcohol dehydrogenase family)
MRLASMPLMAHVRNPEPTTAPQAKGPAPPFGEQSQDPPGRTADMRPQPDHGEETYRGFERLKDRTALITGGDSGIGRAVAIAYAREGADVAISYVGEVEREDAEETLRWVEAAGRRGYAHAADFSDPEACAELVRAAVADLGRIDILVNNAAFQGKSVARFEDISAERVRHTFATNIEAMFHITRDALPHMGPGSTIINSSSIQAEDPSAGILDYASTKAAITDFTKGLAQHLVERGIRVNAVAPGPVWTPLIAQSFPAEKVSTFGSDNPMGRPAQPAELAPTYVFLASDESRFITGDVIAVTGGRLYV